MAEQVTEEAETSFLRPVETSRQPFNPSDYPSSITHASHTMLVSQPWAPQMEEPRPPAFIWAYQNLITMLQYSAWTFLKDRGGGVVGGKKINKKYKKKHQNTIFNFEIGSGYSTFDSPPRETRCMSMSRVQADHASQGVTRLSTLTGSLHH